ncbi:MAG: winged helix-turn-helix domain-containing protein [Candidatus Bathyarchaeia archaeon]
MESRRSKLEIYLEVLQIIKSGTSKPTRIMYQANISWQPLMRVLGSMISQGLVNEIDTTSMGRRRDKRTSKIYEITMKGEQVLRYFKGAKEFDLEEINIPI